jgi:hypothetical protein
MPDSNVYGNLANQFPDVAALTSNALVSNNPSLDTLKTNTNNLQANLNTIQGESNAAISKQQDMQTIVDNENARLKDKKDGIDNAYSSQQRAIYMNDNTQKRYNAYSRILFIVVIILFVIFALIMIQPYLPFIPSIIFNIIIIGLASFMIIYCLGIYSDIQRHEKIDYDRYSNKPLIAGLGDTSNNYDNSNNYDTSFGFCANSTCCAEGTFFDTTIHQCSPGNPPGYKQGFQNIADNSPYEYSEYSKY